MNRCRRASQERRSRPWLEYQSVRANPATWPYFGSWPWAPDWCRQYRISDADKWGYAWKYKCCSYV